MPVSPSITETLWFEKSPCQQKSPLQSAGISLTLASSGVQGTEFLESLFQNRIQIVLIDNHVNITNSIPEKGVILINGQLNDLFRKFTVQLTEFNFPDTKKSLENFLYIIKVLIIFADDLEDEAK
jgi:hypothetical protein